MKTKLACIVFLATLTATAQITAIKAGRLIDPDHATVLTDQIIIIRDNKTGRDIYNEISTDKRFQPFLGGAAAPAPGRFKVTETYANFPLSPSFTVDLVGERTPITSQR